jgi:hypothetical protein
MKDRTAIDTIKGYFYQFDYSIDQVLGLPNDNDKIVIEGVEDLDIKTATDELAVQCKYYAKSEYNHSVIAEPVRQMLSHFASVKKGKKAPVHYKLRGHYKCGQHKLLLPLDVQTLKKNFLVYRKGSILYEHHKELGLRDVDLAQFLSLLEIDINAKDFDKQFHDLIRSFSDIFKCSGFTAEYFYYNNALRVIRELAIQPDCKHRTISKKEFLKQINTATILFNEWFVQIKGKEQYFRDLRRAYFSSLNTSPFERFFLVEIDTHTYTRSELKALIFEISRKWSKLSKRDPDPFCPYLYIHGIPAAELIALKKELVTESFLFRDGFDYEGACFNPQSIIRQADHHNQVKIKIINSLQMLDDTLAAISRTKEMYQFYLQKTYYDCVNASIKQVRIQVDKISHIKDII